MADLDELAGFLARTSRLTPDEAKRVLAEVVAQLSAETVEAFVQRRHRELKGLHSQRNAEIYAQIASEVAKRPFATMPLTERQIRRLIYG